MASRLVRATSLLILGLVALTLTTGPLRATQDEPLSLRYGLYWAGFQIATLTLRHQVGSDGYRSQLDVQTVGLIERLVHYRSMAQAIGRLDPGEGLTPVTYRSQYQTNKKDRRSIVQFDPQSGDVVDLENTKRGKSEGNQVPEALESGVIDPLTAFFQLRDYVATAGAGAPFTAAVFDGRRRLDLKAQVTGRDRTHVAGHDRRVVRVALTLTLVAGSDLDDAEAAAAGDDRFELELLLSDDDRLLPLQIHTRGSPITGTIELLQDCSGEAGCQLAAR